jgi:hypothetical protein
MEDVGVEDVQRIGDERARDPGHVPDTELAVGVGGERSPQVSHPRGERPGHQDRERQAGQ